MEEQAKSAEELRIAEFHSLQAQINPHFLYNTIDMINWLAQQGRTDEVSNAVQSLSRFYKLTLSRKQSMSTIAKETEHVSIYLLIQNMRYHDSISFISDIPDELLEYSIPTLTLQPIIENAILHGIEAAPHHGGTIRLAAWREKREIYISVADDGAGIPSEILQRLQRHEQVTQGSIGVHNVDERLRMLYGEDCGLSFESEEHVRTCVTVHLREMGESK